MRMEHLESQQTTTPPRQCQRIAATRQSLPRILNMRGPSQQVGKLEFGTGGLPIGIHSVDGNLVFESGLPWLAGGHCEILASGGTVEACMGGVLLRGEDSLAGVLIAEEGNDFTESARWLYERLFSLLGDLRLFRIWNFVPWINQRIDGLENYHAFNAGRHQAMQKAWGNSLTGKLPAASALGTYSGTLSLAFVAGKAPVKYFENPLQIPALDYPAQYGKLPPAFARGSIVNEPNGNTWHLSGTASIRGSETCGADFRTQLQLTLENIATLCAHMEIPASRRAGWKIFLRDPSNLAASQAAMQRAYPQDAASMIFLQADICREDLQVEVEGIFHQPNPL